jgi:hypothetical protein
MAGPEFASLNQRAYVTDLLVRTIKTELAQPMVYGIGITARKPTIKKDDTEDDHLDSCGFLERDEAVHTVVAQFNPAFRASCLPHDETRKKQCLRMRSETAEEISALGG